jgi:hypothetical protein
MSDPRRFPPPDGGSTVTIDEGELEEGDPALRPQDDPDIVRLTAIVKAHPPSVGMT